MKKTLQPFFFFVIFLLTLSACEENHEKIDKTTFGFSIPDQANSYSSTIYKSAFNEAIGNNYSLIISNADGKTTKQQEQIEAMANLKFEVIAIAPYELSSLTETMRKAKLAGSKIILVNSPLVENADACISINYLMAATDAAKYLKELKNMGATYTLFYTTGGTNDATVLSITENITNSLDANLYKSDLNNGKARACTNESAAQTMARILLNRNVNAFIAYDDDSAKGILAAIKEAGKTLEEISLISISGSPESKKMVKNNDLHATIALSPSKLGTEVIKTAILLINKKQVAPNIVIPPVLIDSKNIDQFDLNSWQ